MTLEDLIRFKHECEKVSGYPCTVQYVESLSKEEAFEQSWYAFAWDRNEIPFNAYSRISKDDCIELLVEAKLSYVQTIKSKLTTLEGTYDRIK